MCWNSYVLGRGGNGILGGVPSGGGGPGIGGSITLNEIGYGDASGDIQSSPNLMFNGTDLLSVGDGVSPFKIEGGNDLQLQPGGGDTGQLLGGGGSSVLDWTDSGVTVLQELLSPGTGSGSFKAGAGATSTGIDTTAVGPQASAGSASFGAAFGRDANCQGDRGLAAGAFTVAGSFNNSTAVGGVSTAGTAGLGATALGGGTANVPNGLAAGPGSIAGVNSIGLGLNGQGLSSFCIALLGLAGAAGAMAFGLDTVANHNGSMALLRGAVTTKIQQAVIGGPDTFAGGLYELVVGMGVSNTKATQDELLFTTSNGSGVDNPGNSLVIAAGRGTGNADGGHLLFQTAAPGASGGTAQALATRMEWTDDGLFAAFGQTPVARQVVPTGSTVDQVITALQNLGWFSQT